MLIYKHTPQPGKQPMTDNPQDPTTLEDALLGITLLESLVDIEKEELFEQMTDDMDMYDLFRIYSQLCMFWLMTEADENNQTPTQYVRDLRKRIIENTLHGHLNPDQDPETDLP